MVAGITFSLPTGYEIISRAIALTSTTSAKNTRGNPPLHLHNLHRKLPSAVMRPRGVRQWGVTEDLMTGNGGGPSY
ncbi:hypothetical protein L484_015542 [Morus notabilis]|uniref:Uncharacterized protein n=1 Tax=Morus notabilis TaxID=981085 RepID=W9RUM9_9ROSA|nr:hypothetical protein L484_015542 [Morus notabilis]